MTLDGFSRRLCSEELGTVVGRVDFKFVRDMLIGINRARSVNLTAISKALNEDIRLHATHKRLSRNLDNQELTTDMSDRLLQLGAARVQSNTCLIVHFYEIKKKYARKVEYLHKTGLGDKSTAFKVCEILASEPGSQSYTPLVAQVWSERIPGYVSDTDEIRKVMHRVLSATGGKGMMFFDDKIMNGDFLLPILEDPKFNFLALIRDSNPDVLYRNKTWPLNSLLDDIKTPYGKTMFKLVPEDAPGFANNTDLDLFMHAGARAIRLPNSCRNLRVIALKTKNRIVGESASALISTETNLRSRKALMGLVESHLSIQDVLSAHQELRNSFEPSGFRVLTYTRLQLLMTLMQCVIYYEVAMRDNALVNEHFFSLKPHDGDMQRTYLVPGQLEARETVVDAK